MTDFSDSISSALLLAALFSGIPLLIGAVVSLVVGVLQAATQIQEQTLSFVPRLLTVSTALFLFGPWMFEKLCEFARDLLLNLPAHGS